MSKVLVIAPSGFGKTTSFGSIPEYDIKGLNPQETYLVSGTTKNLPFKGSSTLYKVTTSDNLKAGNRVATDNPAVVAKIFNDLVGSPYKNIVWDDSNYIMQNWYMANALAKGWDGCVLSLRN